MEMKILAESMSNHVKLGQYWAVEAEADVTMEMG